MYLVSDSGALAGGVSLAADVGSVAHSRRRLLSAILCTSSAPACLA